MSETNESKSVLEEAQELIHGSRQQSYGHPADDFKKTSSMINSLFGTSFTAADIPILMICVKLSRHVHSRRRDNLVDIAGYAGTAEMVEQRDRDNEFEHTPAGWIESGLYCSSKHEETKKQTRPRSDTRER